MRLFIAINIPVETKEYIFKLRDSLGLKGTFNNVKDTHITLKFLGEVNDSKVGDIIEKLSSIEFSSFKIHLAKFGCFPNDKYIRVFWVGVKPEEDIIELQKKVDNSLVSLFPRERQYKPHLTLARIKYLNNKEWLLKKIKDVRIEEKEVCVEEFSLINSKLSKVGSVYKNIANFKSKNLEYYEIFKQFL